MPSLGNSRTTTTINNSPTTKAEEAQWRADLCGLASFRKPHRMGWSPEMADKIIGFLLSASESNPSLNHHQAMIKAGIFREKITQAIVGNVIRFNYARVNEINEGPNDPGIAGKSLEYLSSQSKIDKATNEGRGWGMVDHHQIERGFKIDDAHQGLRGWCQTVLTECEELGATPGQLAEEWPDPEKQLFHVWLESGKYQNWCFPNRAAREASNVAYELAEANGWLDQGYPSEVPGDNTDSRRAVDLVQNRPAPVEDVDELTVDEEKAKNSCLEIAMHAIEAMKKARTTKGRKAKGDKALRDIDRLGDDLHWQVKEITCKHINQAMMRVD